MNVDARCYYTYISGSLDYICKIGIKNSQRKASGFLFLCAVNSTIGRGFLFLCAVNTTLGLVFDLKAY